MSINTLAVSYTDYLHYKHNFMIITLSLCISFILNTIKKNPFQCCWPLKSLWPKQNCNSLQEQVGSALSLLAKTRILMTLNKQGRQSHCLRTPGLLYSLFLLRQAKGKALAAIWTWGQSVSSGYFSACNSWWLGKKKESVYRELCLGIPSDLFPWICCKGKSPQLPFIFPNLYLSPYKNMKSKWMRVAGRMYLLGSWWSISLSPWGKLTIYFSFSLDCFQKLEMKTERESLPTPTL